jgi:hypothetical protein
VERMVWDADHVCPGAALRVHTQGAFELDD